MAFKEDLDRLERLMAKIDTNLEAFESHITHMQTKLEELKDQDHISYVHKFQINPAI